MKLISLALTVCIAQYTLAKPLASSASETNQQSCDSKVYCQGDLLDTVQKFRLFNDSKSFVDRSQVNPAEKTLENFDKLMQDTNNNPTFEEVKKFVDENFIDDNELEEWSPDDYKENPEFLEKILDPNVKEFARSVVKIWPTLARKTRSEVVENPDRHSLIAVPNGFIIPGGRFKELYYWDSYWIVKGLLLSEMTDTVRGMLENLLSLVRKYGFVPNGSRVYYLNRSQPPLLSLMVGLYMEATDDQEWLKKHIGTLETELKFWLENRKTVVEKNGVKYNLAHYASKSGTPRPESYREDLSTCAYYTKEDEKENCYRELKSGAESGWDFSTRWIFDSNGGTNANLSKIEARRVAPVDLNSYLCRAFKELSKFFSKLGNQEKAIQWREKAQTWEKSIEIILYNQEDGIWYDYDIALSQPRKMFTPGNFAPLWAEAYETSLKEEYGRRAAKYIQNMGIEQYQGGIPTTIDQSGEQWDFPNAWPPLQEIVILGLLKTGVKEAKSISNMFAQRWIQANIRGFNESHEMFEKYDAMHSGQYGGGGEYTVQQGFGWTNGVALSIISEFYTNKNFK